MCDDGARKDYYEIKPFSPTGVGAGGIKLVGIISFMSDLGLPYVPGTAYSPSKDIPIMAGTILGSEIGVTLNVQRHLPGLVTYTICLSGEVAELLLKATIAAVLAWIAALLTLTLAPAFAIA